MERYANRIQADPQETQGLALILSGAGAGEEVEAHLIDLPGDRKKEPSLTKKLVGVLLAVRALSN